MLPQAIGRRKSGARCGVRTVQTAPTPDSRNVVGHHWILARLARTIPGLLEDRSPSGRYLMLGLHVRVDADLELPVRQTTRVAIGILLLAKRLLSNCPLCDMLTLRHWLRLLCGMATRLVVLIPCTTVVYSKSPWRDVPVTAVVTLPSFVMFCHR
jgi:hypothetical protein